MIEFYFFQNSIEHPVLAIAHLNAVASALAVDVL